MKNTFFACAAALFFSASVNAQSTVDSIKAKYQLQAMPEALTIQKTFPVIGSYTVTGEDGAAMPVTVSLDPENKGIIWVDGLKEGKFKAYLRKSPGTYRVLQQKNADGKDVAEGTLLYDASASSLSIALGKKYDEVDPASVFNLKTDTSVDAPATEVKVKSKNGSTKTKSKVVFYNAVKVESATSSINNQ